MSEFFLFMTVSVVCFTVYKLAELAYYYFAAKDIADEDFADSFTEV